MGNNPQMQLTKAYSTPCRCSGEASMGETMMRYCTCHAVDEEPTAGSSVQTGVADQRSLAGVEGGVGGRYDADFASSHALAHVIVGLSHQLDLHAVD